MNTFSISNDERRSDTDRRSGQDQRTEVDTRSIEEQQLVGERRSNVARRLGLERREMSISTVEDLAHKVQNAIGVEQKLDLLARATLELACGLAEIERRIRAIQQNTAHRRL